MKISRAECNICRSRSLSGFAVIGHRSIARCNSCGYLFADAFDQTELNRHYKEGYYASSDDPRIDSWINSNRAVWKGLADTVLAYKKNIKTLLDIGAGSGGFLLEFQARSPQTKLFAVESSAEARVSLSGRIQGLEFPVETADDLGKLAGTYDVITLFQTLEHVYDPRRVCQAVCEKLNPGGVCLITVPNCRSYEVLLGGINKGFCFTNATHLQFFSQYHIRRLLLSAGFSGIKRISGFGGSNLSGPGKMLQYAARLIGISSELRYTAVK